MRQEHGSCIIRCGGDDDAAGMDRSAGLHLNPTNNHTGRLSTDKELTARPGNKRHCRRSLQRRTVPTPTHSLRRVRTAGRCYGDSARCYSPFQKLVEVKGSSDIINATNKRTAQDSTDRMEQGLIAKDVAADPEALFMLVHLRGLGNDPSDIPRPATSPHQLPRLNREHDKCVGIKVCLYREEGRQRSQLCTVPWRARMRQAQQIYQPDDS